MLLDVLKLGAGVKIQAAFLTIKVKLYSAITVYVIWGLLVARRSSISHSSTARRAMV